MSDFGEQFGFVDPSSKAFDSGTRTGLGNERRSRQEQPVQMSGQQEVQADKGSLVSFKRDLGGGTLEIAGVELVASQLWPQG